jgi:hypothetical protein
MPDEAVTVPDFIDRKTIAAMSDEEVDAFLDKKRDLRLKLREEYNKAQSARREAQEAKLQAQLDKQLDMLLKDIAAIDAKLEKADARVLKIRTLRLEMGDVTVA